MDIYVGNLPYTATEEDVSDLFAAYGPVERVKIITDRDSGQSKGFAFVTLGDQSQLNAAIEGLNDQDYQGRALRVNASEPREARPSGGGGGGYGGGGGGGYKGGGGGNRGGGPQCVCQRSGAGGARWPVDGNRGPADGLDDGSGRLQLELPARLGLAGAGVAGRVCGAPRGLGAARQRTHRGGGVPAGRRLLGTCQGLAEIR